MKLAGFLHKLEPSSIPTWTQSVKRVRNHRAFWATVPRAGSDVRSKICSRWRVVSPLLYALCNLVLLSALRPFPVAAAPRIGPQGFIVAREYLKIEGVELESLTTHRKFPTQPDVIAYPTYFEWPQANPPNIRTSPPAQQKDDYGVQILGYFHPPETRAYTFYLCGDNQAELWLSKDEDPANKSRIAFEPEWNDPRNYLGRDRRPNGENVSAPIWLEKGRAYFIEALMKESWGGDNLSVSLDGILPISGLMLSPFVEPADSWMNPSIVAQPSDVAVYPGDAAYFSIRLEVPRGLDPVNIQWQKNGVDLPGAVNAGLQVIASATDNGAKLRAVVRTAAGTLISADATLTVVSFSNAFAPGLVKFEAYHAVSGAGVSNLLSLPRFPHQPDTTLPLKALATPRDYDDDYGARVTGFLIPPESGAYHFFLRSDDASAFYLGENLQQPDPFHDWPTLMETRCCDVFRESPDILGYQVEETSPNAVYLVAGQRYPFVALLKEAAGGDYLQVAVRKVGDPTPAASLQPIPSAWLGANYRPNVGSPRITRQPEGIPQLLQGRSATLNVEAVVEPAVYGFPYVVQWRRNGQDIRGAVWPTYAISAAQPIHGGSYSAVVTAPSGHSVTSSVAVVNYVADTSAPRMTRVRATSPSTLVVQFDEPMDPATAGTAGNYSVSGGVAVVSAAAAGTSALLNVTGLVPGASYTLVAGGIRDPHGNTLPAGSTITFAANIATYADIVLADNPVLYYRFEETAGSTTRNFGSAGSAADGLWMNGAGPNQSVVLSALSPGGGPRPLEFFGFATDNRAASFFGSLGLDWIDARQPLLDNLSAFTIECWVMPANRASDPVVFQSRTGLVGQDGGIEFGFMDADSLVVWTGAGVSLRAPYLLPDDSWHHVAATGDGLTLALYIDGQKVAQSVQATATYGRATQGLHLGGGGIFDPIGNHFTGWIDELAIYPRALPSATLEVRYLAARYGADPSGVPPPPPKPPSVAVSRSARGLELTWEGGGLLQQAPSVGGPWSDVAGAVSPYVIAPVRESGFFRVAIPR